MEAEVEAEEEVDMTVLIVGILAEVSESPIDHPLPQGPIWKLI